MIEASPPVPSPIKSSHMSDDGGLLLRVEEVARLLGVSVRSVWRLTKQHRCPRPLQLGRSTRWRKSDIELWVAQGCPNFLPNDRAPTAAPGGS